MATIPGAMLLCASSPYARRGALFDAHRKHFGKDGDPVLVWHAPTRDMNPCVPQAVIDAAMERDPAHAAAEYLAEFRSDIECFIKLHEVERCVSTGIDARPPLSGCRYRAFVDPSGGSNDTMTLAIAHREDRQGRDRPGDRTQATVQPGVAWSSNSRQFSSCTASTQSLVIAMPVNGRANNFAGMASATRSRPSRRSDLYVAFLPLLTSQMVELVDQPRLIQQIVGLERRTARGGRDTIDHAPNGSDRDRRGFRITVR